MSNESAGKRQYRWVENVSHITSESVSPTGPSEVRGADKAGLSGRNQSQMWSGPRHGGPTTSALSGVGGEKGVVGEGPQLVDLWPRAGKNHEPMLTAAMDTAGDLLSSLSHMVYELWVVAFYTPPLKNLLHLFSVLKLSQLSCCLTFIHFYSNSFSAASPICPTILSITQTSNLKRFQPQLETEQTCHCSKWTGWHYLPGHC